MINPFEFGPAVRGEAFIGRQHEVRRTVEAILKGNSLAITAEPRTGKTSILYRLQENTLYGEMASFLHFIFLDAETLTDWDVQRFWSTVLAPIKEMDEIRDLYFSASLENFGTFLLERLFMQLEESGHCLVILLDEFDLILDVPGLHKAEFYGSLRTLATRFKSLCLVLALRQPLEELNRRTQQYSRLGSPYFNFLSETSPSIFSKKEVATLLEQAGKKFTRNDRRFLAAITGGHPYFLQAAAYYLWEAYAEKQKDPSKRREWAGQQCFTLASSVLKDTWRTWSPYQQMAFTLAILDEIPRLLPDREFDINRLLHDRPNFGPEQRILQQRGFIREDKTLQGGYAPQAEVMVWFLAEELTRLLRPENPDLTSWLHDQQWEGLLKHGEKESLTKALLTLKPMLADGAQAFIRAAAEGFGKGISSAK